MTIPMLGPSLVSQAREHGRPMAETKRCLNPDCRRELTDPVSKRRGYGRKCWEDRRPQLAGTITRQLSIARRAAEVVDGQLAFDEEPSDADV